MPELDACRRCLPVNRFAEASRSEGIDAWRPAWQTLLTATNRVLCFSESSLALVRRAYAISPGAAAVVPHEVRFAPERRPVTDLSHGLVVGVFGSINHQKGRAIVVDMVRAIEQRGLQTRIVVVGLMIHRPRSPCFSTTGPYDPDDLPRLVEEAGVNVAFLPSIWPETFSYVTEELLRLGLPIVAFDLGAPAERLRGRPDVRLVSPVDAGAALEALQSLFLEVAGRAAADPKDMHAAHASDAAPPRQVP